ncbi:hypothetical protein Tco_1356759 [Tanacetum coccineum]
MLFKKKLKEEKKINEKWLTSSKKVSQSISKQIPHQKKKILGGELFTESSSKMNENENLFVPASMGYDQEMVPKTKDWVERLNPDNKLPNFNTGRILMLIDEMVNSNQKTQDLNSKIQKTESSKSVDSSRISQDSKPKVQNTGSSKSLRPEPIQKPQLKCELCHYTNHLIDDFYRILYCMICKREDHRTSDHEMYTASLKRSENYLRTQSCHSD